VTTPAAFEGQGGGRIIRAIRVDFRSVYGFIEREKFDIPIEIIHSSLFAIPSGSPFIALVASRPPFLESFCNPLNCF
jgi:hypothetical protein